MECGVEIRQGTLHCGESTLTTRSIQEVEGVCHLVDTEEEAAIQEISEEDMDHLGEDMDPLEEGTDLQMAGVDTAHQEEGTGLLEE